MTNECCCTNRGAATSMTYERTDAIKVAALLILVTALA
jgi:hypothetical protein